MSRTVPHLATSAARARALGVIAATLFAVVWLTVPGPASAQTPGLSGDVTPGGASLVVWGGGTPSELAAAASQRGCAAASVWGTANGQFLVFVFGAPAVVNQAFLDRFGGGSIPGGTALVLVCGAGAPPANSQSTNAQPPTLDQQFSGAVFDAINSARAVNGKASLRRDSRLQVAAEEYVRLLVARGELGHSFDGQPWDRAQRAGYPSSIVGEVVASRGTSEALSVPGDTAALMQGWMSSAGHRDIILGREFAFSDLGVGCATGKDRGGLNTVVCVAMTGQP